MLCYVMLRYVMLCYFILCYRWLCYVTLRYVVLQLPYVYVPFPAKLESSFVSPIDRGKDIAEDIEFSIRSCLIHKVNCKLTDCFSSLKEKR